jgi:hypothetical protein
LDYSFLPYLNKRKGFYRKDENWLVGRRMGKCRNYAAFLKAGLRCCGVQELDLACGNTSSPGAEFGSGKQPSAKPCSLFCGEPHSCTPHIFVLRFTTLAKLDFLEKGSRYKHFVKLILLQDRLCKLTRIPGYGTCILATLGLDMKLSLAVQRR